MAITTAKGTILQLGDGASPFTFAAIGQVRSISGPTSKAQIQDITTHDTPGYWRRKLAVLVDPGEITFKINFNDTDATHMFATGLWNQMIGLIKSGFTMIFPNSAGSLKADGYVGQHAFDAPVDNVLMASIMCALTDAVTGTDG